MYFQKNKRRSLPDLFKEKEHVLPKNLLRQLAFDGNFNREITVNVLPANLQHLHCDSPWSIQNRRLAKLNAASATTAAPFCHPAPAAPFCHPASAPPFCSPDSVAPKDLAFNKAVYATTSSSAPQDCPPASASAATSSSAAPFCPPASAQDHSVSLNTVAPKAPVFNKAVYATASSSAPQDCPPASAHEYSMGSSEVDMFIL